MTRYNINPGELRHKITFQRYDKEHQNDYGEPEPIWVDVMTISAAIYPLSGREFFSAEKENSEVTHKINIRYVKGLSPSMQIMFGDRLFSIISIINFQERNVELQIMCKELI
jgi:SPP1 family predicted phage head-tail adaptor